MINMQSSIRKTVEELFSFAGVSLDGKSPWDIKINDERFFNCIVSDATLGFGESYTNGWWDCDSLDECVNKIYQAQLESKLRQNWKTLYRILQSRLFNLQKPSRAFQIAVKHYNLGNDLYKGMLDKRMNYTCAYWKDAANIDEAQEAKLELVCRKLNLRPGLHVLDLGCGWGSFAKYAAEKYNVRVTGINVSREQVELGKELCKGLPVELRLQDYREVQGQFDAVISIGIMEHVGYKNYKTYMQVADRCLKKDGIAFIHTIGRNDSATSTNAWIHKYIFPNSMLPSIAQIARAMESVFAVEDLHNLGPHYDRTLMAWYSNFEKAWPGLHNRYGDRFYRMWRFYLLSCAGGFRSRANQLWHLVMTRIGTPQPECRFT